MPKIYGYARCSLAEQRGQDLHRQTLELKAAGAEEIITEREHGDAKVKPQLDFLLAHIEAGSTLIVCEVSRLSRSVLQFCEIMETVKQKHLQLVVIGSITVDCRNGGMDPMSAAFLQMASIFSELEKKVSCGLVCVQGWRTLAPRATGSAASPPQRMTYRLYSTSTILLSRLES